MPRIRWRVRDLDQTLIETGNLIFRLFFSFLFRSIDDKFCQ